MDFLCKICDKPIIENESKYNNYIATLKKLINHSMKISSSSIPISTKSIKDSTIMSLVIITNSIYISSNAKSI